MAFATTTIQRWDVVAGKRLEPDLSFQEKLDIWKLRFNDSGNVLTAETSNGPVSRLFDPKTGDALSPKIESEVVVSPDGKLFAAVGQTKKVTVQEVGTNKTVGTLTPELFDGTVHRLAFSPDGKMAVTFSFLNDRPVVPFLAFVAGRNRLKVWSTTTGKVLAQSDVIDGGVIQVRMSPDGKSFASSADATVQLWKMPAP